MGQPKEQEEKTSLIAKKDWHILSGGWDKATGKQEFDFRIKKGDDLERMKIPPQFIQALKTEGVI